MANYFDQYDATGSAPVAAKPKPNAFDRFDGASAAPLAAKPQAAGFGASLTRGFKRSLPETKSLLYGAGAAVAGAVGADGLRDKALENYQRIQRDEVTPLQGKTGFIDAIDGKGSIGEWAGDTIGNFGGQAVQSLATAAAGAALGSEVPVVGNVAGAAVGLVGKNALKKVVGHKVADMLVEKAATAEGRKLLARGVIGGAATTGLNIGQEAGISYTGRADDAAAAGEQLTAGDAVRALGAGTVSGLVDTAAEGVGVGRLFKGASGSPRFARRVIAGATAGAATEGGTEAVQAVLERYGAQQALTGADATRDYIENFAAGALGGGAMGAPSGFHRQQVAPRPQASVEPAGEILRAARPDVAGVQQPAAKPFPDAAPGSVADVANVAHAARVARVAPQDQPVAMPIVEPGAQLAPGAPPVAHAIPAQPAALPNVPWIDPSTGEPRKPSDDEVRTAINGYLDQRAAGGKTGSVKRGELVNALGLDNIGRNGIERNTLIGETLAQRSAPAESLTPVTSAAPARAAAIEQLRAADQVTDADRQAIGAAETVDEPNAARLYAEVTGTEVARGKQALADIPAGDDGRRNTLDVLQAAQDAPPAPAPSEVSNEQPGLGDASTRAVDPQRDTGTSVAGEGDASSASATKNTLSYDNSTEVLDSDITPPSGGAFGDRQAAELQAKRHDGGKVMEVDGGFVVRTPAAADSTAGASTGSSIDPAPPGAPAIRPGTDLAPASTSAPAAAAPQSEPALAQPPVVPSDQQSSLAQATPAVGAVQAAADTAATSHANDLPHPTEAQKEVGNYKKGHARVAGLDISIENPAGSRRRPEWPPLKHHYGYLKGTIGADKDHVDVFLTEHAEDKSRPVFVVDQNHRNGKFDEHKVVLGAANEADARKAYLANYEKGWTGLGAITQMSQDEFKAWVKDPTKTKTPAARVDQSAGENVEVVQSAAKAKPNNASALAEGGLVSAEPPKAAAKPAKVIMRGGRPQYAGGARETLEAYFQPGRIVKGYGGDDRVLGFDWNDGTWSVKVQAVDANGNPPPNERVRNHSTLPQARDLVAVLGKPMGKASRASAATKATALAAPPAPVSTPAPTATIVDAARQALTAAGDGTATLAELRAAFLQVRDGKDAVVAELNKMTKDQLRREFRSMRADSKPELVSDAYRSLLSGFTLHTMLSFQIHGDYQASHLAAVQKAVDALTDADLAAYAKERGESRAKFDAKLAGIDDPKTVEDFARRSQLLGGESKLTPEQRATFDALRTEARREQREAEAKRNAVVRQVDTGTTGMSLVETKHTRDGHDLFVVQMAERVDGEVYNSLNAAAKKLGGHYSSYRGHGAVPGFTFRSRDAAEQFMAVREGNVDASAQQQARSEAKADARSESLADKAEAVRSRAQASLNQDRKDNTARRARMASSAEDEARKQLALADTMSALAKAIEAGTARLLAFVRHKSQVQLLDQLLRNAHWERQRAQGVNWEKAKEAPITAESVTSAMLPSFHLSRGDAALVARRLQAARGGKALGVALAKQVDYGDEYGAAVQDNPLRFLVGKSSGGLAYFARKRDADAALARSPDKLRGVVVKMPRAGKTSNSSQDWAVALAPELAIERKLWAPDYDKKIALSPKFAEKVMSTLGVGTAGDNSVPYWWASHLEERNRLAKLGIETSYELREALREYLALRKTPAGEDTVRKLERALAGKTEVGIDFFPTPPAVVSRMVEQADVGPGMHVLEPSAGKGDIAEALRDAAADVQVDTVEMSHTLRELLEAKGFDPVGADFLQHQPEQRYDRIVMNPPFGNDNGASHVRHAYSLLKPGGRIVAVMGAGTRGKAAFETWLESVGGLSEPLPDGSFKSSFRPTGVSTVMVVIDHAEEAGSRLRRSDAPVARGAFDDFFATIQTTTSERGTALFSKAADIVLPGEPGSLIQGRQSEDQLAAQGSPGSGQSVPELEVANNAPSVRSAPAASSGGRLTFDRALQLKSDLTANWGDNAPNVVLVQNAEGFPASVKADPDHARAEGVYLGKNTVWLNVGQIRSEKRFAEVLAHEALGHYGVERIVGAKEWAGIVDAIEKLDQSGGGSRQTRAIIAEVHSKQPGLDRASFAKEVIAFMAEKGQRNTFTSRIVAAVRRFLGKMMPSLRWREIDVRHLLAQSDSFLRSGRTRAERIEAVRAYSFSTDTSPGNDMASGAVQARELAADSAFVAGLSPAERRSSAVTGLARALWADMGTDSPFFRDWFGESKVVDSEGQPQKVYHGTADEFDAFDPARAGKSTNHMTARLGLFFAEDKAKAKHYARIASNDVPADQNVLELHLAIRNPYRMPQAEFMGIDDTAAAQALRERLKKEGYDGIQLHDIGQWIAFDAAQIKSTGNQGTFDGHDARMLFSKDGAFAEQYRTKRVVTNFAQARLAAREIAGKPITNTDDGLQATLSRNNVDKMLSASAVGQSTNATDHALAVGNVDQLFAGALLDSVEADKRGEPTIRGMRRYVAPMITPRGEVVAVKMTIKETVGERESNPIYTLQTLEIAKPEPLAPQSGIERDTGERPSRRSGFTSKVEALLARVKSASADVQPGHALFSKAPADVVGDVEAVMAEASQHDVRLVDRARAALKSSTPAGLKDLVKRVKDASRSTWLGALTTRHLTELGSDYFDTMRLYSDYLSEMGADRNQLQAEGEGVAEAARKWVGKNREEAQRVFKLMHDATIDGVDPAEDYQPYLLPEFGGQRLEATRKNLKQYLKAQREVMLGRGGDSKVDRMNRIKAAKATVASEPRRKAQYPSLVERWNAMSDDAKAHYVAMRDLYATRSDQVEKALVQRIEDLRDDQAQNEKGRLVSMIRQQFESQRLQGVYFPLQRFGQYFVAAERDGASSFLMFEKLDELERAVKGLKARGFSIKAQGLKGESKAKDAPSGTFVADVIERLHKAGVSEKTRNEIYQMYLQALPELSMRKHSIHRKAVPGFDPDALRAFAYNMQHGAHQLARLRFSHKMQDVLDVLRKQQEAARTIDGADTRRITAGDAVLEELGRRHEWISNPQDSKLTNLVSSAGFVYYLGLTPAAALVNITQTALVTYPYLASRFGGIKAMNSLLAAGRDAGRTLGHIQKKLTDPDELRAHQVLQQMGALDKTQAHNLAGIAEGGMQGYNPAWAKAMEIIGWGFHTTEVINREATGIAAFRLAKADGMDFAAAVKFAADTINDTHFDYSNANRARFMQGGTAKVLLMFRQYSLNITWHLGRMVWQATKGQTPEVKKIARRNLAGILGMSALFSGAMGLPMMGLTMDLLNAVASSFGDDDEPWDAETELRAFLADMLGIDAASVLLGGPVNKLTGADIGSRVSLSQLWFRDADRELDGRGAYYNLLEQAAGPMGGVLKNALVGKQLMDEGNLWRGVETVMPKALKDAMKGARYASEGVNTLRGDPLVKDASLSDMLLQVGGFTPDKVAERYDRNRALKNYEQALLDRRGHLMDAIAMALRTGDESGRADAVAAIQKFNQTNPEIAITSAGIRRSLSARAKYSERAEGGVVLNARLAAKVKAAVGE